MTRAPRLAVVQAVALAALLPALAVQISVIVGWTSLPLWHWTFAAAGVATAGLLGTAVTRAAPPVRPRLLGAVAVSARLLLIYLLIIYGVNKLLPGQFLVYNRDLDLPLAEVPSRRVAWHFLGYSPLYVRFAAFVELLSAALLAWPATRLAGLLLTIAALSHIVVVDVAFGIRAVPIPVAMLLVGVTLLLGHVTALRQLLWRAEDERGRPGRQLVAPLIALLAMLGWEAARGLESRAGLMRQMSYAGRWETLQCDPDMDLPLCRPSQAGEPPVLYLEIGWWGELRAGTQRWALELRRGTVPDEVVIRIPPSDPAGSALELSGVISRGDTVARLAARRPDDAGFSVTISRTRTAPWPPTGWAR